MGNKFPRASQALSLGQQDARMRALFPGFQLRHEAGCYLWYGDVQPLPTSSIYRVRIRYEMSGIPEVKVLNPKLEKRSDSEQIPHVYPGNKLCLYRPKKQEWTDSKFIAETIVPWISIWLYYYELWLATGEWLGGGEHPPEKELEHARVTASAR